MIVSLIIGTVCHRYLLLSVSLAIVIFCYRYLLLSVSLACGIFHMWYLLPVVSFPCAIFCMWYILQVVFFACGIFCMCYLLHVISFPCDIISTKRKEKESHACVDRLLHTLAWRGAQALLSIVRMLRLLGCHGHSVMLVPLTVLMVSGSGSDGHWQCLCAYLSVCPAYFGGSEAQLADPALAAKNFECGKLYHAMLCVEERCYDTPWYDFLFLLFQK